MEHDDSLDAGLGPGLCGSDRELFERVWRRVMPEDREACPIQLLDQTESPASQEGEAPSSSASTPQETTAPILSAPAAGEIGEDFPTSDDVPCLGASSAVYTSLLQDFISQELLDWRAYQSLAKRAGAQAARIISSIAADERRHAKRLSTAYFLISAVRFWPDRGATLTTGTYLGTLRQRFSQEQRGQSAYLSAAEDCTDPCLRELFLELAADEAAHARLIRGILEMI